MKSKSTSNARWPNGIHNSIKHDDRIRWRLHGAWWEICCDMRQWLWIPLSLAGLIITAAVFLKFVLVREAVRSRIFPVLRPLYKHVFNPRVLRAATQGETSWGVVHHVGRRSGTAYD